MIRPGHHAPLGTTAKMRFRDWQQERLPRLGDVAAQCSGEGIADEDHIQRAYRIVGYLEGRTPESFTLIGERIPWDPYDLPPGCEAWCFYNVPRERGPR